MEKGKLSIKSVMLDGNEFNDFDAQNHTIILGANQGGKLKVTFETSTNTSLIADNAGTNVRLFPNLIVEMLQITGLRNVNTTSIVDISGKIVHCQNYRDTEINMNMRSLKQDIFFRCIA